MRANTKKKHRMGRRFAIVIGVAVVGVMALGAQTTLANSEGRTEGDARAAFNAVAGAGGKIEFNNGAHQGAPIGGFPTGTDEEAGEVHDPEDVRIYQGRDGWSYCASGWHVIFLAAWDDASFYDSKGDLFAYLDSIDMDFAWDGVELVEERTGIKRANFEDVEDGFFVAFGSFMPPGSLSVGKHRLTTTVVDPLYGDETWSVRVNILPC
jgi:hypothetical protein